MLMHVNHNLFEQLDCAVSRNALAQNEVLQWNSLFHAFHKHIAQMERPERSQRNVD
jgi:hypothetical protein